MDPTEPFLRIQPAAKPREIINVDMQSLPTQYIPLVTHSVTWFNPNEKKIAKDYINSTIEEQLSTIKATIKQRYATNYSIAKRKANPFENIPLGYFTDKNSLKMANLDAIFNILSNVGQNVANGMLGRYYYIDISTNNGWSNYIQYRRPMAIGYAIGLTTKPKIDRVNFYSDKLYDQLLNFITHVKNNVEGVDLLVADGGFTTKVLTGHEIISLRLILAEILLALDAVKVGGNVVLKLYNTKTKPTLHLLYLLSLSFDSFCLIKPVTSRLGNSEKYFIGKGKRKVDNIVELLTSIWKDTTDNKYAETIIKEDEMVKSYAEWLTQYNNYFAQQQLNALTNILELLQGKKIYLPAYDLDRCLTLWNIPNKVREKYTFNIATLPKIPREYLELETRVIRGSNNDTGLNG